MKRGFNLKIKLNWIRSKFNPGKFNDLQFGKCIDAKTRILCSMQSNGIFKELDRSDQKKRQNDNEQTSVDLCEPIRFNYYLPFHSARQILRSLIIGYLCCIDIDKWAHCSQLYNESSSHQIMEIVDVFPVRLSLTSIANCWLICCQFHRDNTHRLLCVAKQSVTNKQTRSCWLLHQ